MDRERRVGDVWFRGEGVGVAPASPGSTPAHDLGDGMYLTDRQDVAKRYAEMRSPEPAGQRVYSVTVNTGSLKVLDLTRDERWKQYMQPLKPGMPSNETFIKQANENYGKFFQSFCKQHKINLNDYDAVIGPEYVRGGKQMVILSKGGKPAPLQATVRGNFRVVMQPGATPTRMPTGALTFKGKIGAGLKTAGGAVATVAISALIGYLEGKLRERFAREEFKKLEPKIGKEIAARIREVAQILMDGGKPYANITITVTTVTNNLGYFTPAGEPGVSYPIIELADVAVSTRNLSSDTEKHTFGIISPMDTETIVYSVPLELSKEEVDLYRAFVLELRWYEDQLRGPIAPDYVLQLSRERNELAERFNQAFAPPE